MKKGQFLKKVLSIVCVLALSVSGLTGCGTSKTSVKPEKATDNGEKSKEQVEIKVTLWDYATTNYWSAIVDEFEKQNPDIKVKVVDIPSSDYDTKLPVMLSSGDDSDVVIIKSMPLYTGMIEKGQIDSLDEYIQKDNVEMKPYLGIDESMKYDGKLYAMPFRNDYYVLYYNKDIFDAAGIAYPDNDMTWDEYRELAKKLTSGEGNDKIYGAYTHTWPLSLLRWGLVGGEHTMLDGNYDFFKQPYELFLAMQNEDKTMMEYGTLKTANIHYSGPFYKGQVAMMPMGTWVANLIINAKNNGDTSINWGIAKAPHFENQDAGSVVSNPTPIALNSNSKNKDAAWKFIKFACTEPGANVLASLGTLPAYQTDTTINTLVNVDGFPEGAKEALEVDTVALEMPIHTQGGAIDKAIAEEHDLIMLGGESVDEGIANMNRRVQEILNK
jgi:multiple sugar transport system substrate-binding protein